jgi:hypothetical protein
VSVVHSLTVIGGLVVLAGITLPRLAPAGGARLSLAEAAAQTRDVLPVAPEDTARVSVFLASVRGAPPLVCGLAGRVVEGRYGWSRIQGKRPSWPGGQRVDDSMQASSNRWRGP